MQLDNTRVAIREREFLELLDLSLQVIRAHALPWIVITVLMAAPLAVFNAWVLSERPNVGVNTYLPTTRVGDVFVHNRYTGRRPPHVVRDPHVGAGAVRGAVGRRAADALLGKNRVSRTAENPADYSRSGRLAAATAGVSSARSRGDFSAGPAGRRRLDLGRNLVSAVHLVALFERSDPAGTQSALYAPGADHHLAAEQIAPRERGSGPTSASGSCRAFSPSA